ncbi:DarT ssDNA thymidine ADP-ribosyltransferase family protein [Luteibacter yeojuensis]
MNPLIQAPAVERGITRVLHFTQETNLASILAYGLVTRDQLAGHLDGCNDHYRLDGTDAVCASIGFPNYKMFYRLRCARSDVQWVVLELAPSVLWERDCAFCAINAATNSVTAIPLAERRTLAAFHALFGDFETKPRQPLALPSSYPTNPQAEVLILNGVPRAGILRVAVPGESAKARVTATHPGVPVVALPSYFSPRRDHSHW